MLARLKRFLIVCKQVKPNPIRWSGCDKKKIINCFFHNRHLPDRWRRTKQNGTELTLGIGVGRKSSPKREEEEESGKKGKRKKKKEEERKRKKKKEEESDEWKR